MKSTSLLAGAIAMSLLVAGCVAEQPSITKARGDTSIRVVLASEPTTLNPMFGVTADSIIGISMVEPFVRLDDDLRPSTKGLATAWERTSDTTWRFTVKDGVKFHDGTNLNAAAVARSLQIQQSEPGPLAAFLKPFKGIAVDERTLEVKTEKPTNVTPASLASLFVVSPDAYARMGKDAFAKAPVGSGPYVFDRWQFGRSVSAHKNIEYWDAVQGPSGIEWSFAPDPDTRLNLLLGGQADVAADLTSTQVSRLPAGFRRQGHPTTGIMKLQLNKEVAPLNDPRLRKAISMAIDRQAIVKTIFAGQDASSYDLYFNEEFGIESGVEVPPHDLQAARSLVSQVGEGTVVPLRFPVGLYPKDKQVAEAVAGMLGNIGLSVKQVPVDASTFFQEKNKDAWDGAFLHVSRIIFPHPSLYVGAYLLPSSTSHYCKNPRYKELNDAGLAAPDENAMRAAYRTIEEVTLNEDMCWVSIYQQVIGYAVSDRVAAFTVGRDQLINYRSIKVAS